MAGIHPCDLSLGEARALIQRAVDKAEQLGLRGGIAVVGASGGLTSASTTHISPYGPVRVAWQCAAGPFELSVSVPPGTTATVVLPGAPPQVAGPGRHTFHPAGSG
ncbi:hypothetical protein OHA72_49980 [Dactylosporangium sp. NBC_01737]|uniref:alpha-L-rhamnosidase C-terminal domain-containing protein n=1 Tax=Dactylosporangium sp. NBC_01737 TaxID=2975959 RepID=UPI002E1656C1|nr:hypothetical protein OHA72_49980 [Dactylosporangium sp. NBC_01737]